MPFTPEPVLEDDALLEPPPEERLERATLVNLDLDHYRGQPVA
jgi:hypothetical protein